MTKEEQKLRATPRDDDSGIPWDTRGDLLLDSDGDPLGWCESPEDAAHIAAAIRHLDAAWNLTGSPAKSGDTR